MNSQFRRKALASPSPARWTRALLPSLTLMALAGAASSPALSAEHGYEMTFYEARPGGAQIASGDYDAAIASAEAGRMLNVDARLVAATNLCVAYALQRAFEKAERNCSYAVSLAITADRSALTRRGDGESAKALNNRGVVRALRGDAERAFADFRRATIEASTWGVPEQNARTLDNRMPSDEAVARAAED